jgi:outer membrane protein TolC
MALGFTEGFGVTNQIKLDELASDAATVCKPVPGIEQRSDVGAASVELEAARRSVDSTELDLAPTIDVTSNLTYNTSSFTANGKPVQWTIGALLTIPLYDGGARYAQRHTNTADAIVAAETLTQTRRQALIEVQQAFRGVQVARQNYEVSKKSRDLAIESSRLSRLAFINGKATSFELVDATRRQQQAELDLAVKEFEAVRAHIIALLAQSNCDL